MIKQTHLLTVSLLILAGCQTPVSTVDEVYHPIPSEISEVLLSDKPELYGSYYRSDICDQIIQHDFPNTGEDLTICYDYEKKSALYVGYRLDGELVHAINIEERPEFYTDTSIPSEYATTYSDYTHSGYNRGHLASDASFDYDSYDLGVTYSMANIIPQDPTVNRTLWAEVEKHERYLAYGMGYLHVINGVVFSENPDRLKNNMAIPKGFWKRIWNEDENFEECYYYDNFIIGDVNLDTLEDHKVDCEAL